MMELSKRRRTVTEPEARYFCYQIVSAVDFLHRNKIIHRDLKLGNLFLNDDVEIKVGDFGLATKLDFDGERKKWVGVQTNQTVYWSPEFSSFVSMVDFNYLLVVSN